MANKPNPIFTDFEQRIDLGPTHATKLLGLPYISYAQIRAGMRPLKRCHVLHIEVILLLPRNQLRQLIEREVNGSQPEN